MVSVIFLRVSIPFSKKFLEYSIRIIRFLLSYIVGILWLEILLIGCIKMYLFKLIVSKVIIITSRKWLKLSCKK